MTTYAYTVTEYNVDEPWLIASTARDSVELDDGVNFHDWARERWPSPRYGVKMHPAPFPWAARDLRATKAKGGLLGPPFFPRHLSNEPSLCDGHGLVFTRP